MSGRSGASRSGHTFHKRKWKPEIFLAHMSQLANRLLDAWLQRFVALDAVRAVLPDVDEMVEYGKMREAEIAAAAAAGRGK
ncbi:hypothetical protein ACP70R_001455 [Stipagrostis hirtigluma subsp. patula]